jgi:hypothetical protein
MGNCTGKPYTSFSKLEEEKERNTVGYMREQAKEAAYEAAPTVNGMYDARRRLRAYEDALEAYGYHALVIHFLTMPNAISRMSDAQVEMAITLLGLDER